jgi:hypothetical protein
MDRLARRQPTLGFAVKVSWKHLSIVGIAGAIEAITASRYRGAVMRLRQPRL